MIQGETGAIFSPCKHYRYVLWRTWNCDKPIVLFIGLNPSTADGENNDPTIRRCIDFAQRWGYGTLYVANLFGLRASKPSQLKASRDPIGAENDGWLTYLKNNAHDIVACWGNHGCFLNRNEDAIAMLPRLFCLAITKQGQPAHPLYLPKKLKPILFKPQTLRDCSV